MIQALIFDFDGLILETEQPVFQSWQELYHSLGCEIPFEVWGSTIGTAEDIYDPFDELERQLERQVDRSNLGPQRRRRELELIDEQPIMPGVENYLLRGRALGLKIGLASSSSCAWVTGHLKRLDLIEHFDSILGSDDVKRTKPAPDLYLLSLEKLGVSPDQAVVFEDSPNGVAAAKTAGIFAVAVPNIITRQLSLEQADLCLDSLEDMPLDTLLGRLNQSDQ
jgi:HAD superfamily hydrolase (TIGR01509 family)